MFVIPANVLNNNEDRNHIRKSKLDKEVYLCSTKTVIAPHFVHQVCVTFVKIFENR